MLSALQIKHKYPIYFKKILFARQARTVLGYRRLQDKFIYTDVYDFFFLLEVFRYTVCI